MGGGREADEIVAVTALEPGDVLGDRFVIESLAGVGGMGEVYRAHDRTTGELVAIKVVRTAGAEGTRFSFEIAMLSELAHPAIVRYIAHGEGPGGRLFLAMEWLQGEDLAARLARGPLEISETLSLGIVLASALGAAHSVGIVHRDVKPSNVFLVDGDPRTPKLLDFGIARPITAQRMLTVTGTIIGTPHYMSPEQAGGDFVLDGRSDVYSLGCLIFEAIAGRRLRTGSDPLAVLAQALLEDAPRLSELGIGIDRGLDALVARVLARERTARPMNGAALALELAAVSAGDVTTPTQATDTIVGGEQRLRTTVVVDMFPAPGMTMTETSLRQLRASLEPAVVEYGARIASLGERVLVAAIPHAALAHDQALRAGRLALQIRDLLPTARVAVMTERGSVTAGNVSGDLVVRALALLEATRATTGAGPINVDALTADLIGTRLAIKRDDGGAAITGASVDRDDYEVLGRAVPCVGREQELARLDGLLAESTSEMVARSIVIVGDAGVGKSRLCDELCTRVRRRSPHIRIVKIRAQAEQAGSPFAVVGAVIRDLIGLARFATLDETRTRLSEWAAADSATAVFLAELVGAPFSESAEESLAAARRDAQLMADRTRGAWRQLMAREAASSELMIVVEDLHWADITSIKLLELALRDLHARPLLIVATRRTEATKLPSELWVGLGDELVLAPLSDRAAERLVRSALGERSPPELVQRIIDRAAGNPLYLEELVRASATGSDALPDSVLAAVQGRFDAMGSDGKLVLKVASVFGERFWLGGIEAILATTGRGRATRDVIAELVSRELIVANPQSRMAEVEYRFRHALFREAAYALWLEYDRGTAHRIAARWLETAGERDAVVLGEHCKRGGLLDRAGAWFYGAAEQALRGGDLSAAIEWSEAATECLAGSNDIDRVAQIRLLQAEAHFYRGEVAASARLAQEAMERLPRASERWFRSASLAITAAGQHGNNERVCAMLELVLAQAPEAALVSRVVETLARGVTQLAFAGDPGFVDRVEARSNDLASGVAVDASARHWRARAASARAFVQYDFERALEAAQAAIDAAECYGDQRAIAFLRIAITSMHVALGDFAIAEQQARRALAGAQRVGAAYLVVWAHLANGKVFAGRGDLASAREELDQVIAGAQDSPRIAAGAHMYISYAACESGAFEMAAEAARAALALKISQSTRASALALLSRALQRLGEGDAALAAATEANEIADAAGHVEELEVLVRLSLVEALDAADRRAEARTVLSVSRDKLLTRAGRIRDPVVRDGFLANRLENAALLRLARQFAQE